MERAPWTETAPQLILRVRAGEVERQGLGLRLQAGRVSGAWRSASVCVSASLYAVGYGSERTRTDEMRADTLGAR